MKALLLKDARIFHKAGEIVEISPAQFQALASIGVAAEPPKPKKTKKEE